MNASNNPLLQEWDTPFGLPPFHLIKPEHYLPAFEKAMAQHAAEITAIGEMSGPATFANTIEEAERTGRLLERVSGVFFNLASADTNDELLSLQREISPQLSRHYSSIYMNKAYFNRVDAATKANEKLTPEQVRLLERYHTLLIRAGAKLSVRFRDQ